MSIRVLLTDDHEVVRAGYARLLESTPDIEVIAEAVSGEEACSEYFDSQPDVLVMDLSMPGIGGLEACRRILARDPKARILVFSIQYSVFTKTRSCWSARSMSASRAIFPSAAPPRS